MLGRTKNRSKQQTVFLMVVMIIQLGQRTAWVEFCPVHICLLLRKCNKFIYYSFSESVYKLQKMITHLLWLLLLLYVNHPKQPKVNRCCSYFWAFWKSNELRFTTPPTSLNLVHSTYDKILSSNHKFLWIIFWAFTTKKHVEIGQRSGNRQWTGFDGFC